MLNAVMSDLALSALDDDVRTLLATAQVGLFTGAPPLTPATTLADLVALAPTYTGYALLPLTLGAKRQNAAGDYLITCDSLTFQPTGTSGLPVTLTGYFVQITVSAVDKLWASELFDTPQTFTSTLSAYSFVYEYITRQLQIYGGQCSGC